MSDGHDPPRRPGAPSEDDLPPQGEQAKWDRWRTASPLIWLALGLVIIGVFAYAVGALHSPAFPPWAK
ncbi:MAG TPA: hypothetical protein VGN38_07220 [Caulobacteraceae bacterium]|jgi:hypothetical protein|nr:hypothetical protein [Caulobacteraceae bacterium]